MARMPNPTSGGMEFGAAILGVLVGGLATTFADRFFGASHPLTNNNGTLSDAPAAGQTYNSIGAQAPLWANPIRLAVAAGSVIVPFIAAKFVKSPGGKSFLQLWGFSALTVTTVKLGLDVAAKTLGAQTLGNGFFPRVLAPEIDGSNAADYVKTATSTLPAYTLQAGGTGPGTTYGVSGTSKTLGAVPGGDNGIRGPGVQLPHPTPVVSFAPPAATVPPMQNPPPSSGGGSPIPVNSTTPVPTGGDGGGDPSGGNGGLDGPDDPNDPEGGNPDPWACPPYRPSEPAPYQ